jgi:hypothetical protein
MEGAMTPPEVNFSMTFPGGVDDSNATEVDGNTATWDLTDASLTEIEATAGPAGFPTLMVAAAVGGLALVALLAFFLIRRSRSVAPATAASIPGATYPGATYPGGTYPAGPPTWDPNPVPATAHDAWADETPAAIPAEPGAVESQSPRSAPVATAAPLPAAGWFPDPKGEAANRYWDGNAWTDHTSS